MDRDDKLTGTTCSGNCIGSRHGQGKAAFKTWGHIESGLVRLQLCRARTMQIAVKA